MAALFPYASDSHFRRCSENLVPALAHSACSDRTPVVSTSSNAINERQAGHARNIFGLPGLSFIAESVTSARPKLVIPTRCLFIPRSLLRKPARCLLFSIIFMSLSVSISYYTSTVPTDLVMTCLLSQVPIYEKRPDCVANKTSFLRTSNH